MNTMGIHAIYPHKKKLTSIKNQEHRIYPYLLREYWRRKEDRTKSVFVPNPNEVWSSDITYIRMNGGFMYLCAIIVLRLSALRNFASLHDWHTRAILSYKISSSMDTALATDVLKDAISKYGKPKIFNSDQGSQYTSHEHTQILKDNGIQISMIKRSKIPQERSDEDSGKGRSIDMKRSGIPQALAEDHIAIERFFRTLKHGNIYISDYKSISELKEGVKNYIYKYNFERFHSSIGYKQPMNYYLKTVQKAA